MRKWLSEHLNANGDARMTRFIHKRPQQRCRADIAQLMQMEKRDSAAISYQVLPDKEYELMA
jgi:hypothetical protein